MSILVKGSFCYPIVFLPNKRSRKMRKTVLKSFFYQAYLELEESEFPLVFEYKDKFRKGLPVDNVHVRSYNGEFYEQVAFNMTHSGILDFFKRTLDYSIYNSDYAGLDPDVHSAISNSEHVLHKEGLLTEESIIRFDLKNEFLKRALAKESYKDYVIFKDGIWRRCNEPKYIVEMPISVFDERIPHITITQKGGIFNALQLEEGTKADIRAFEKRLLNLMNDSGISNEFGEEWLGHIAYNLHKESGLSHEDALKETLSGKFHCRGTIQDIENFGNELTFSTVTAYSEPKMLFDKIIEDKKFSHCKLFWFAIEPSNGYYATNDQKGEVFGGQDYHIEHEWNSDLLDLVGEPDFFSVDEARASLIKLVTSSLFGTSRLSLKAAEELDIEDIVDLVKATELFDNEGEEILICINKVQRSDS